MSQNKTLLFVALTAYVFTSFITSARALAHDAAGGGGGRGSGDIWQRSTQRESSRWTLAQWLEQRDRSRMMDIWLSMNSPSPYEFKLGYFQSSYDSSINNPASKTHYISTAGNFSAYAQIFGLSLEYENNIPEQFNDVVGKFDLRLLGNSIQNSNLTFHVGQRTRTMSFLANAPQVKNLFAELSLCLHFSKFFGLTGVYRYYQPTADASLNTVVSGSLSEGGAFIDFKAVRVFGSWYSDLESRAPAGGASSTDTTRTGYKAGVEFYF